MHAGVCARARARVCVCVCVCVFVCDYARMQVYIRICILITAQTRTRGARAYTSMHARKQASAQARTHVAAGAREAVLECCDLGSGGCELGAFYFGEFGESTLDGFAVLERPGATQSRRRCGRGDPRVIPAQMWQGRSQSRRRCARGKPSPGADMAQVPDPGMEPKD
jgi:hypothetical protein